MPSELCTAIFQNLQYFTPLQLKSLDRCRIPKHIAIIPDGNRRWAKRNLLSILQGHQKGCDSVIDIVKAAKEIGVQMMTFYTFSTENWSRPAIEVKTLMNLLISFLQKHQIDMVEQGIKLETIGDPTPLPKNLVEVIQKAKLATKDCNKIQFVLAVNYGGRDELCRTFKKMLEDCENGQLKKEQISESIIANYLDTAGWEDPDLIIRTSGESRISNYLLWQSSYSEIYTSPILWPDFRPVHLMEAIENYQQRQRRWGKDG